MLAEVDVFISNYTIVDPDIYQLWIEGYSSEYAEVAPDANNVDSLFTASESVALLKQRGFDTFMGAPLELFASDVLDQYRTYSLIERLLYTPTKLMEQPLFQLEPQTRSLLIEKFVGCAMFSTISQ